MNSSAGGIAVKKSRSSMVMRNRSIASSAPISSFLMKFICPLFAVVSAVFSI